MSDKVYSNNQAYLQNPLIHKNRRVTDSSSKWQASFSCETIRPLIICRGPIRKEAMDTFDEMGVSGYGILLSEKDSITYPAALAPELRKLTDPSRLHRVPDYSGSSREERQQRISQIISIAKDNGYNAIFAGYGFMAEDEALVSAIEEAKLTFIGPCSKTVRQAGQKDEAKRTALSVDVSVTPGVDNLSALTLLDRCKTESALKTLSQRKKLGLADSIWRSDLSLIDKADMVLNAGYRKGLDLVSTEALGKQLEVQVRKLFLDNPANRIRLKAIGGGGGKGQRILEAPKSFRGSLKQQIKMATDKAVPMYREILAEVKSNAEGDNKNILLELNIESTRHQEIQVVGNGTWCVTLGGRDCSLQMHEQKLIEVSVTVEELSKSIETASVAGHRSEVASLRSELLTLKSMEDQAVRFGEAVGLDSVSTFECIVEKKRHFFMEMNTRVQVEHRVSELCYGLIFTNPDDETDQLQVDSILELMVLLACHGHRLPKPGRTVRENSSVEVRLNATNAALQPHAGGVISSWSNVLPNEIRDDQGISLHNPDTNVFMKYHVSGAYDSNIALLLSTGQTRLDTYQRMSEILRRTRISGVNLETNHDFHYGLVNWFLGSGHNARPTTAFIAPYLCAVALLKQNAEQIDLKAVFHFLLNRNSSLTKASKAVRDGYALAIEKKRSLLIRPIEKLFERPHLLAGWLARHRADFQYDAGNKMVWMRNPINILADTYHYLDMDFNEQDAALHQIWDHDLRVLKDAQDFYAELTKRLGLSTWLDLQSALAGKKPARGFSQTVWKRVIASHTGYQLGMELLASLPHLARESGFYELRVNADLSIHIPARLKAAEFQAKTQNILAPPPEAGTNEIVAVSGGMFYAREAPASDPFVMKGQHFERGDPLYIVEVMKMFNTVYAQFSGTVDEIMIETDGAIIKKGQLLLRVSSDSKPEELIADSKQQRVMDFTQKFLGLLN